MKVYLTTSGDYDAYSVNEIYLSLESAKAANPPPEGYHWQLDLSGYMDHTRYWSHRNDKGHQHWDYVMIEEREVLP